MKGLAQKWLNWQRWLLKCLVCSKSRESEAGLLFPLGEERELGTVWALSMSKVVPKN